MAKLEFLNKFKWFQKLKNVKHIELILVVILTVLILLIWFVDFGGASKKQSGTITSSSATSTYAQELESRLKKSLSRISGAGEVEVMITLDGVTELVLATTKDEKTSTTTNTTSSGAVNSTENITVSVEPILITENGSTTPIVLMEIQPDIKGVIVIAQGASDVRVKLDLLKAVQALLAVNSNQVEIFTGN